jgi:hypothetical protein
MAGSLVLTNSGVTAVSLISGGDGGVWYTTKDDGDPKKAFSSVSDRDGVPVGGEYAGLTKDTTRYVASASTAVVMNVMTYMGYTGGTGTLSDFYTTNTISNPATDVPYTNDKRQCYSMVTMVPPVYDVTGEVYIIRHGNGTYYSKIEVTDFTSAGGNSTFEIMYQNFQ